MSLRAVSRAFNCSNQATIRSVGCHVEQ
uniref:Uncharacterized protein n=1 Tax=Arundo donax TaxID=35708 RepID=A0A0A9HAE0_ARUDO